jgi:hypothetical protein
MLKNIFLPSLSAIRHDDSICIVERIKINEKANEMKLSIQLINKSTFNTKFKNLL